MFLFRSDSGILVKRLTRTVIRRYILTFFALLVFFLVVLCPMLVRNSLSSQDSAASFLATQYQQMSLFIQNTSQSLSADNELSTLLNRHAATGSATSFSEVEQKLQSFVSSFSSVQYCLIEAEDGTEFQSFSYSNSELKNVCTSAPGYERLRSQELSTYYSPIYSDHMLVSSNGAPNYWMYISRKTLIGKHRYILTLVFKVDDYISNCKTIMKDTFNEYLVFKRGEELLYSSLAPDSEDFLETLLEQNRQEHRTSFFSRGVLHYENVNNVGWSILLYSSWFVTFEDILRILIIVLIFYILPPILFYINIVPTTHKFLAPLGKLTEQISNYSAGDRLVLDIHTGDEVETLANSVNQMTDKICLQIEEIRQKEHENSITHYSLLATEIDPHFIYNTLSIINSMARKSGQTDIVEINTALSKILRERFSTKASVFETIASTLDTLAQYHTIMKYRYNNQVQISVNAETDILQEKLPKNLLLPVIENSYYHGLSNNDGEIEGEIELAIYSLEEEIVIEISDGGSGISPERLEYLKTHEFRSPEKDRVHIGLSNVYERLHYIYKEKFHIDISSTLGFGTTVSITIPKYQEEFEII